MLLGQFSCTAYVACHNFGAIKLTITPLYFSEIGQFCSLKILYFVPLGRKYGFDFSKLLQFLINILLNVPRFLKLGLCSWHLKT